MQVSLLTLLCQSDDGAELEQTARELGCTGIEWRYGAMHAHLPSGERGSFRPVRDGVGFTWCAHDAAE